MGRGAQTGQRLIVNLPGSEGDACQLHSNVLGDLAAKIDLFAADTNVADVKSGGGRDLKGRAYSHPLLAPDDAKAIGVDRRAAGLGKPGQVDAVDVEANRILESDIVSGAGERVHLRPDGWIAGPPRLAELGALDQFVGVCDEVAVLLPQDRGKGGDVNLGAKRIIVLVEVHGAVLSVPLVEQVVAAVRQEEIRLLYLRADEFLIERNELIRRPLS